MKKYFYILLTLILIQCARQSQPAGGPKDVDPPELLDSNPKKGEKNFKGKVIELTFNEFIKLKNPEDEIVIAPSPGGKTKFIAKKNKVVITPEKNWKDSTTYSIAFRDAVQDINESNPAEDLHLAFSTGPTIDSLKIFGYVTELFNEKIPEKITVAIYQADTFDIFTDKPTYFTKTNKKGKFTIQNLKAGKYFIYAFDDKNKNSKVDSKSERFGFKSAPFEIENQKDSLSIELIHLDTRPIKVTSVRNTSTISTIRFNKPLDSILLKSEGKKLLYTYGDNRSEVNIFKNFDPKDSIKVSIKATDSLAQKLDSSVYIKYTENKTLTEKFKISDWQVAFDINTKILSATSNLNKLISSINYDSIYIQLDSTKYQYLKQENTYFDTLSKAIKISAKLNIEVSDKTLNPILFFGKGAIVTLDNDSTKIGDYKINIPKTEETGILSVEIKTEEKYFEVQLLKSGKVVDSFRDKTKYTFNYLTPSEYKIQIVIDPNNNRRWDAGNFYKKQEPERVILYKNQENKYSFPVRANWEVGPLVITF